MTGFFIEGYPPNYDPREPPHKNTLEAAKVYSAGNKYSAITFQNGRYEVWHGDYLLKQGRSPIAPLKSWVHT